MKELYLHVGIHKTATSSIQVTLFQNRNLLKSEKCFYPSNWGTNHSVILYSLFSNNPEKYHLNIKANRNKQSIQEFNTINLRNITEEIRHTECEKIIFSGEDLIALTENNLEQLKLFIVQQLKIKKIHIIVYVRELLSYSSSEVQEVIKGGVGIKLNNYSPPVEQFYFSRLNKFIEVFGKNSIQVHKYEDACEDPNGPVGFFLRNIGISDRIIKKVRLTTSNISTTDTAVDLINFINLNIPLIDKGKMSLGRFTFDTDPLLKLTGKKFIVNEKNQANILHTAKNDLVWLKENFNIDYLVQNIKKENLLEFDESYFKSIKEIYFCLSPLLKILVLKYFQHKKKLGYNSLDKILNLLESQVLDYNIVDTNNLKTLQSHLNIKKGYKKADIFRDIAIYFEKYNLIDISMYYMVKAKELRPNGPLINKKLEEYHEVLHELKTRG